MADNDNGTAIGLGWFLAGLGLGALVGVLYAPKAGKETREDLRNSALDAKDKAGELYDQGLQKANDYAEQGRQYYEQGRNKAGDLLDQGRHQANQVKEKGREFYERGRSQWSQYVEKGKDLAHERAEALAEELDSEPYAHSTPLDPAV